MISLPHDELTRLTLTSSGLTPRRLGKLCLHLGADRFRLVGDLDLDESVAVDWRSWMLAPSVLSPLS